MRQSPVTTLPRIALNLALATIKGSVNLSVGFEADGEVELYQSRIGADLNCISGHFFNPGNVAIDAIGTEIAGLVNLSGSESTGFSFKHGGPVKVNGHLRFRATRMGALIVWQAIFSGAATTPLGSAPGLPHGLEMTDISVRGPFMWQDVTMESGTQLDLRGASMELLGDQERSWPALGNLFVDG